MRAHWRGSIDQYAGFTSALEQEHDLASFVAREVIAWIEGRDRSKPFFVTFAPNKPHHPYGADPKWAAYYAGKTMPRGPRDRVTPTNPLWAKVFAERYRAVPAGVDHRRVRRQQQAHVLRRHLAGRPEGRRDPRRVGGSRRARLDWVLYSSDHGELMGDHGLFDKTSSTMPRSACRVSCGRRARRLRKSISAPTEAIDLAATILDIAGAAALDAPGRSLLPVMRGEESPRYAFSRWRA